MNGCMVEDPYKKLALLFLCIVAITAIIEGGFLLVAYLSADKISCTWLWCTFTTTREKWSRECYQNGMQVNCTDVQVPAFYINDNNNEKCIPPFVIDQFNHTTCKPS